MADDFIQKNRYKLFSVGAIGTFMATLDGSILNVALPTISRDLDCPIDIVAWVVLAYSLTLIALMLAYGSWVGKKGYAFAYKYAYAMFMIGSLICALSQNIYLLIFGRVIQATGTAMFAGIGTGMVTNIFPSTERGKGIGIMTMMVSAGHVVGPPLGGIMLDIWPWQSIFVINLPIGLFGLYMTFKYFKMLPDPATAGSVRLKGAISISTALVVGTFSLSLINDYAFSDVRVWGGGLLALLALATFFFYESKPESAMIGLDVFRNRQFTSSVAAMLMMFMSFSGVLLLVPFYLEHIKHFEPRQVGLYLIILPVMMFIFAPASGRLSDRIGFRLLTTLGLGLLIVGFYLLSGLEIASTGLYIALALVIIGIGNGIFNSPNSSALMGSVSEEKRAIASGILATTRNIGMAVGVAVSTTFFAYFQLRNRHLGSEEEIFIQSYNEVIYISIVICALGLPFCMARQNKLE